MPTFGAMVVAIVVVGAASVGFITMGNTTIQLAAAPPEMRGRVMALYVTAIIGTHPDRRPDHRVDRPDDRSALHPGGGRAGVRS